MQLSIIICTYNVGQRLKKTLDSILAQGEDCYEVIIVDGVSTDGTINVIESYQDKFGKKLLWSSEKDSGIYNAINKGVKLANGEYLNIIGAGDWMEKDVLNKVYKRILQNNNPDVVYGKTRVWNAEMTTSYVKQTLPETLSKEPMQHPAMFYKRELHERFGLYDERYRIASDYAFCLKSLSVGKVAVKIVPEIFCNFVTDGISSKSRWLSLKEVTKIKQECGIGTNFLKEVFLSTRLGKRLCHK
ncbi:MAG: glycosyltransferase family 2 protein [Parcubacteria group bacterium]|jgi:glycosyltransferase involved in cell wall biosynthesis